MFKQEDGDNKVLKLRFDVSQYAPEEIVVKTVDQKLLVSFEPFFLSICFSSFTEKYLILFAFLNFLFLNCRSEYILLISFLFCCYARQVHAKHEEKSDTKSVYREYNREFLLPKGVNPELIKSSLSKDGVLTVDAPLPLQLQGGEKLIPIAH